MIKEPGVYAVQWKHPGAKKTPQERALEAFPHEDTIDTLSTPDVILVTKVLADYIYYRRFAEIHLHGIFFTAIIRMEKVEGWLKPSEIRPPLEVMCLVCGIGDDLQEVHTMEFIAQGKWPARFYSEEHERSARLSNNPRLLYRPAPKAPDFSKEVE